MTQRLGPPFHVLHLELRRGSPGVRTHCEFVTPCRFGETLALDLERVIVGTSSIETRMAGTVEGAPRFRARHKTAMMSMETMRAVPLAEEIRKKAAAELVSDRGRLEPAPREAVPKNAFRSRQLVRYAHCDPGERVYFARFFDMFNAALSLVIDAEFLRACVLGEPRLRAAWKLCTISLAPMKAVPIPDDLRRAMQRYLA